MLRVGCMHAWHGVHVLGYPMFVTCVSICVYLLLIQLAQPIRLLLKYTGTEFEDVQYDTGECM